MLFIKTLEDRGSNYYTKKYIFEKDNKIISSIYIDRINKNIICLSSMYGCPVQCGFCMSGENYFGNIHFNDIVFMINSIVKDNKLTKNKEKRIVFSFMGAGEVLLNYRNIAKTINYINEKFSNFSISISISGVAMKNFQPFIELINFYPQIQLSLHSPIDSQRKSLIPNTGDLVSILETLSNYKVRYKKPIELNYILLNDTNDSETHALLLSKICKKYDFKLKINEYHTVNKKYIESKNKDNFIQKLKFYDVEPEIYKTDGIKIKSACGQIESFLTKHK